MARCGFCNKSIVFGGVSANNEKFCTDKCLEGRQVAEITKLVPSEEISREVEKVHAGDCPQCLRRGPVDVHISHRVWSALVLTQWSSQTKLCCHSCGTKNKLRDSAFCLFLGWWGFPWGIFVTPFQIGRNVIGIFSAPNGARPSPRLERFVTTHMATSIAQQQGATPPPLPRA